ncbi:MAG: hypothetical protein HLUCCA04_12490 [Oceanicaulis sp. HLUCCA04]|nr:MAG: hypothetical protein HLUCCA04_12490 [Oceanicaulis sp. HLUCCA04]
MGNRQHEIAAYAHALDAALHALAPDDRADIVQEARTHLEASAQAGRLDATLAAFGKPQSYALQFLEGAPLTATTERGMWSAAGGVAGSVVMALLAAVFVTVAVIDILVPAFGIWVNPASGAVYFGNAGLTTRAEELAGAWLSLVSISAAAGTAFLSFVTARAALREIRRYLKASSDLLRAGEPE